METCAYCCLIAQQGRFIARNRNSSFRRTPAHPDASRSNLGFHAHMNTCKLERRGTAEQAGQAETSKIRSYMHFQSCSTKNTLLLLQLVWMNIALGAKTLFFSSFVQKTIKKTLCFFLVFFFVFPFVYAHTHKKGDILHIARSQQPVNLSYSRGSTLVMITTCRLVPWRAKQLQQLLASVPSNVHRRQHTKVIIHQKALTA